MLGGATSVLLLGTAVVGGAALRRDHEAFVGALRRRGAVPAALRVLVAGEVGLAAPEAALLGWSLAGAAAGRSRSPPPPGSTRGGRALGVVTALPAVLGLAVPRRRPARA